MVSDTEQEGNRHDRSRLSSSNRQAGVNGSADVSWSAAVIAGVVAGTGAGIVFHYQLFILQLFGALYGWPTSLGGAALHAVASIAFGLGFAALLTCPPFRGRVDGRNTVIGLGLGYGGLLWGVVGGTVLPLLTRIGPPRALPLPYLTLDLFVAHLLYGGLLGVTYVLLRPS